MATQFWREKMASLPSDGHNQRKVWGKRECLQVSNKVQEATYTVELELLGQPEGLKRWNAEVEEHDDAEEVKVKAEDRFFGHIIQFKEHT